MINLRETIEVPRPLDDVFSYVSDFGNSAQWDPGVAESTKTSPGRVGVGTEFDLRVRFGPRSIPMAYVIRAYEPPSRVVLEGTGDSVHALDDIEFAATPRGTRIAYAADISLRGAVGLVEPWLKGVLDRVGKNAVRGLQAALADNSATPTQPAGRSAGPPDPAGPRGLHQRGLPMAQADLEAAFHVDARTNGGDHGRHVGSRTRCRSPAGRARRARDPGGSQQGEDGVHPTRNRCWDGQRRCGSRDRGSRPDGRRPASRAAATGGTAAVFTRW